MSRTGSLTLFLKLIALSVLCGCVWVIYGRTSPQTPNVVAEKQPDSSLQISAVKVTAVQTDPAEPSSSRVEVLVKNVGTKPVRAFAISSELARERGRKSGLTLMNMTALEQMLQPQQSREYFLGLKPNEETAAGINLSVDFIEFADGSVWGADYFNSLEQLEGRRAGGSAALRDFRELFKTQGADALIRLLGDKSEPSAPPERSEEWKRGYRTGVAMVRERLHKAHERGGVKQLSAVLQQPFDASQGRRQ